MKKGFTLAEVLITLGIIGVVAALTMPSLIAKHQEKERIVRLKKAYSIFSNAVNLAKIEHGDPNTWFIEGQPDAPGAQVVYTILKPYLKTIKDCGNKTGCWAASLKELDGNPYSYGSINTSTSQWKLLLVDGMSIGFTVSGDINECVDRYSLTGYECAVIHIDVNGKAPPNTFGKDIFRLIIHTDQVIPSGLFTNNAMNNGQFHNRCTGTGTPVPPIGIHCAAWVIAHDNMDYLRCAGDLSWGGQTSCR